MIRPHYPGHVIWICRPEEYASILAFLYTSKHTLKFSLLLAFLNSHKTHFKGRVWIANLQYYWSTLIELGYLVSAGAVDLAARTLSYFVRIFFLRSGIFSYSSDLKMLSCLNLCRIYRLWLSLLSWSCNWLSL